MPRRTDMIGRQSVMARHLLAGRPGTALRAEFAPQTLSPVEAQSIVQAAGWDKGLFEPVFEALTNPIVVVGAMLSFAFPVLKLKEIYGPVSKEIAKADKLGRLMPPGLREMVISPSTMLRTEPALWDALIDVSGGRRIFYEKYIPMMEASLQKYSKKAGGELSEFHGRVVAAVLDDLGVATPKHFKHFARPGINPKTGKAWSSKIPEGRLQSPFDPQKMNEFVQQQPGLSEYINDTRKILDNVYDDLIIRHPGMKQELQNALTKKGRRLKASQIRALESGDMVNLDIPPDVREYLKQSKRFKEVANEIRGTGTVAVGDKLENYWMHALPKGIREVDKELIGLMRAVAKEGTHGKQMSRGIDAAVSDHLMKRAGRMLPDLDDLKAFEGTGLLNEKSYRELQQLVVSSAADPKKHILPYALEYRGGMQDYMHKMAATYAFNVRGSGRLLTEGVQRLSKGLPGERRIASVLENTMIPLAAGKPDFQRAVRSQYWAGLQYRLQDSLDSGVLSKLPGDLRKWMQTSLKQGGGPFTGGSLESGLANLMYSSTLGGNMSSVMLNSMQTLVTTGPMLGRHTVDGIKRVFEKGPKYFKARVAGADHHTAVKAAFPEFIEMGMGGMSKIVDDAMDGLAGSYSAATAGPVRKGFNRLNSFLMSAFEKAETFNQLVAFEGTMAKAAFEGVKTSEALLMARRTVLLTQFPGGAVNAPLWVSRMKGHAGGRLGMMFSQFAMRFPEFLFSTATAAGSGTQAAMGRNWGTLGRAMLVSGLAYETGKVAGLDLSRGLIFGALPEPREDSPFYPFPIVSPPISVIGNLARDMLSGEFPEKSRYSLPLMVPGGVAAARAVGLVKYGQGTAAALGRKYVDYEAPAAQITGQYPIYSEAKSGTPTLTGYVTLPQLLAQGLGLPVDTVSAQEPGAMEWLVKNRDRIRGYKQEYMETLIGNDPGGGSRVINDFHKAYPKVQGGLLSLVQKRDIEAVHLRRNVARIERVMDTLPKEVRPIFAAALQASVFAGGSQFLGIPPEMLQQGTVRSRGPARPGGAAFKSNNQGFQQGRGGFSRPFANTGGLGGPDPGRRPENISRHQLPDVGVRTR